VHDVTADESGTTGHECLRHGVRVNCIDSAGGRARAFRDLIGKTSGRLASGAAVLALVALGAVLSTGAAIAAAPASPHVVEYTIQVSLDPDRKTLDGTERLVWRNPSGDPVPELRFHMYLNAFKNNRTTFMRESNRQLRGDEAGTRPEDWGWIDVLSMVGPGGKDLRPAARFIQPDGNDPADETVLSVPLPSPVPPHGEIALDIKFRSKLPRVFARTGYFRDYFLVGQWFPKLAVFEPAGLPGLLYWYVLLPVHALMFGGMLRQIARRASNGRA